MLLTGYWVIHQISRKPGELGWTLHLVLYIQWSVRTWPTREQAGAWLSQDRRPGSAASGVCPPASVPVGPYYLELLAPNSEPWWVHPFGGAEVLCWWHFQSQNKVSDAGSQKAERCPTQNWENTKWCFCFFLSFLADRREQSDEWPSCQSNSHRNRQGPVWTRSTQSKSAGRLVGNESWVSVKAELLAFFGSFNFCGPCNTLDLKQHNLCWSG